MCINIDAVIKHFKRLSLKPFGNTKTYFVNTLLSFCHQILMENDISIIKYCRYKSFYKKLGLTVHLLGKQKYIRQQIWLQCRRNQISYFIDVLSPN